MYIKVISYMIIKNIIIISTCDEHLAIKLNIDFKLNLDRARARARLENEEADRLNGPLEWPHELWIVSLYLH